MRHLEILLLFLLLAQPLAAQYDHPFPDSAAAWTNAFYYYPPPPPGPTLEWTVSYCATGEDTLIDAIAHKKLFYCNGAYKGALRTEPGKVFFVPADSLQEYTLYNFTLNEGDTAHNVYMESHSEMPEPYITSLVINQVWIEEGRRHIYSSEDIHWIEGVGSRTGLFWGSGLNVSNYLIELACMSINDSIVYPGWQSGTLSCPFFMGIEDQAQTPISVYPNPTTTSVTLSIPIRDPATELHLYDALGARVLVNVRILHQETIIDMEQLPQGIYFLHLLGNMGSAVRLIKL
jgi:hypothetical protein